MIPRKALIIDTETTGFPLDRVAPTSKAQARVIQLAALLVDEDGKVIEEIGCLLKPEEHFKISEGAAAAHGITLIKCEQEGALRVEVFDKLESMMNRASILVAHNLGFDSKMLSIELACLGREPYPEMQEFCTMEAMTPICKLSHKSRSNFGSRWKWPKLQEAYFHLFGRTFEGKEHDGVSDCKACLDIYKWLVEHKLAFVET